MTQCCNTQCSAYGNCNLTFDCPLFKLTSEKLIANKYQAQKCVYNGEKFDSRKELQRYLELRLLERNGEITDLRRQVKFELIPSQKDKKGKCLERAVTYIADFVYKDRQGNTVVEDTKGMRTKEYIIKRKLMLYFHGIRIREV